MLVGGVGYTVGGRVTQGRWVHLALVVRDGGASFWIDGERTADLARAREVRASFTIGDLGNGTEFFEGDISRVRLSSTDDGGFDPDADLLIDREVVRKEKEENRAQLQARLRKVLKDIPLQETLETPRHDGDWLVEPPRTTSTLQARLDEGSATLVLANGLISRTFHLAENAVCYSLRHEAEGTEFLRSIKPEATLTIDGREVRVGGMDLPARASGHKGGGGGAKRTVANYFLADWLDELVAVDDAFRLVRVRTSEPEAWLDWEPMSQLTAVPWPPKGLRLLPLLLGVLLGGAGCRTPGIDTSSSSSREEGDRTSDAFRGMDENGRIPKVEFPADIPNPDRWRYLPEGRIVEGDIFERLLVSTFFVPLFFFEGDVGAGAGVSFTDIDFRNQRRREFATSKLTYTTEGQAEASFLWRRWLDQRDAEGGGVFQEERSFVQLFAGYSNTLTRRFFGIGPETEAKDETSYADKAFAVAASLHYS